MSCKLSFALLLALSSWAAAQGDGMIKATTKIYADQSKSTTIVDPVKATAEEVFTNAAGKPMGKKLFTLDERNFSTGVTHFDAGGKVRYKEVYTRDSADRIIEAKLFSPSDANLGKRVFKYDAQGRAQIEDYDVSGNLITKPVATSPGRPDKPPVRKAQPVKK